MSKSRRQVPLRAVIEAPPAGVAWALQRSKGDLSDLAAPSLNSPERLVFEFAIEAEPTAGGGVRLLGPCVQGPPTGRFFYLNSGTYAGQTGTPYGRRAKLSLMGLTWPLIEALGPGQALEIRIGGTGRDGGPVCATIPLPAWKAV